jgi:hypothetical protein
LKEYNDSTTDEKRRFEVRIGINANTDNLVTDINGEQNTAGAGINVAQRVMDMADGNQILVSQAVYETLRQRERYMSAFKQHRATLKHGERVNVYQLTMQERPGLSTDTPTAFQKRDETPKKLTKQVAYHLAHAIVNRQTLREHKHELYNDSALEVLLSFLAEDSVQESEASEFEMIFPITYQADTFWEQYEYYGSMPREVINRLAHCLRRSLYSMERNEPRRA